VVKLPFDRCADVNARERKGRTPLGFAVYHGHVEVLKLLVDAGADVNIRDGVGWTP
jgi:cytohesin